MRIALVVGASIYHLAGQAGVDERTHSSAADFNIDPEALQTVTNLLRAENAMPRDRGNLLVRGSFSTSRLFASAAEAWAWSLDYDSAFPRSGTLRLDLPLAGGGVMRRELVNAVIERASRRVIGCTVLINYQFMGSEVALGVGYPSALTVSGATAPAGVNGSYAYSGITNGRPQYTRGSYVVAWNGSRWELSIGATDYWISTDDEPHPAMATPWTIVGGSGATGTLSVVSA